MAADPSPAPVGTLAGHTLLAVFAHPDDEALACGGTLARAADAGARIVVVCASRGELGPVSDEGLLHEGDLGVTRAHELLASAAVLGAAEVVQLSHADGYLRWSEELDADISSAIVRHRPDTVITFDADGLYWHGDHVGVHERATAAIAALGDHAPGLYYVSLPAGAMRAVVDAGYSHGAASDSGGLWGVSPEAFGVAAPTPDFRVDVRPWIERKLAAIRCHLTQVGVGSPFAWIDAEEAGRWLGFEYFRRSHVGGTGRGTLELLAEGSDA